MVQLTGFSDPVYAEAYVNVNQYDIVLDVLVVNQTSDTLQGLTLELATLGVCVLKKRTWCTLSAHACDNHGKKKVVHFLNCLYTLREFANRIRKHFTCVQTVCVPSLLCAPGYSIKLCACDTSIITAGDLKLVEKPMPCTVGPHDFVNIKVKYVI